MVATADVTSEIELKKVEAEKLRYSLQAIDALSRIVTGGQGAMGAATYLGELRGAFSSRDPIEEMLIDQIAITHARVMKLSAQSLIQQHESWYRTMSETCDRAANTFRRLVGALREYREPRRTTVMAIQQANLANQQLVQQISGKEHSDGEALPFVTSRQAIASGDDQRNSAVASIDGPENDRGQESFANERVEAWRPVGIKPARRTRSR